MEHRLVTPISEATARNLRAGDVVYLSGTMVTARDEAHRLMLERGAPLDLTGLALFHCGPVVQRRGDTWQVVAAGPTTSARLELFESDVLARFGPRLIVGKGGMGDGTLDALSRVGAAYAHFTGGAGALAARAIQGVLDVHWLDELGMPEAVWVFAAQDFGPLVVAMDSHGHSLYEELAGVVQANLNAIHQRIQSSR